MFIGHLHCPHASHITTFLFLFIKIYLPVVAYVQHLPLNKKNKTRPAVLFDREQKVCAYTLRRFFVYKKRRDMLLYREHCNSFVASKGFLFVHVCRVFKGMWQTVEKKRNIIILVEFSNFRISTYLYKIIRVLFLLMFVKTYYREDNIKIYIYEP